ncbi:MAG: phosphatidylglycerophosphatase A, partial [Pseudomonadota bacterium]
MRQLVLSFFGAGYLKPAPGTWGSLAALPAAWVLVTLGGPYLLVIATGFCFALGVAFTRQEMEVSGAHDP